MSQTKTVKKGWPSIGSLRKGENGSYIKLDEGVEIFVNGEKLAINESRTVRLEDPRTKVEQLLERGVIDEQKAGERLAKLETMPWLRYNLIVAPPKTT